MGNPSGRIILKENRSARTNTIRYGCKIRLWIYNGVKELSGRIGFTAKWTGGN